MRILYYLIITGLNWPALFGMVSLKRKINHCPYEIVGMSDSKELDQFRKMRCDQCIHVLGNHDDVVTYKGISYHRICWRLIHNGLEENSDKWCDLESKKNAINWHQAAKTWLPFTALIISLMGIEKGNSGSQQLLIMLSPLLIIPLYSVTKDIVDNESLKKRREFGGNNCCVTNDSIASGQQRQKRFLHKIKTNPCNVIRKINIHEDNITFLEDACRCVECNQLLLQGQKLRTLNFKNSRDYNLVSEEKNGVWHERCIINCLEEFYNKGLKSNYQALEATYARAQWHDTFNYFIPAPIYAFNYIVGAIAGSFLMYTASKALLNRALATK